jgi:hypothetical protein
MGWSIAIQRISAIDSDHAIGLRVKAFGLEP